MPIRSNANTTPRTFDLEQFFEASFDLLCIAGFDGYFKKINTAVSRTLGYSKEELYQKPIHHLMHPEDREITMRKRDSIHRGEPLLNFENRYITKSGEVVWILWTSVPVEEQQAVFAIGKNITVWKKWNEYQRIADVLNKRKLNEIFPSDFSDPGKTVLAEELYHDLSPADSAWLAVLENLVKSHIGKKEISISMLGAEMAMSERQLFRRIKQITGFTPNKYIRIIRLHLAKEAIDSGRYRTVSELSGVAGFETPAYFNKLFKEVYGVEAGDLLRCSRADSVNELSGVDGMSDFLLRST